MAPFLLRCKIQLSHCTTVRTVNMENMMKTHKKTGISFRPLFLTTVVGFACQHLAMAQGAPTPTPPAAPTVKTSPFLPRPPQLYNEKTTSKAGVPPNVMLLVDDSGSMQASVGAWSPYKDNWSPMRRCTYNESNNIHWTSNPGCYLVFFEKNRRDAPGLYSRTQVM